MIVAPGYADAVHGSGPSSAVPAGEVSRLAEARHALRRLPGLAGAAGVASFASSALSERLEEKASCAIRAASARSWSAGRKRYRPLTRRKTRWVREASYRVSASQNANARVTRFVTSKLKLTVTAEVISQPSIATRYRNLELGAAIWAERIRTAVRVRSAALPRAGTSRASDAEKPRTDIRGPGEMALDKLSRSPHRF